MDQKEKSKKSKYKKYIYWFVGVFIFALLATGGFFKTKDAWKNYQKGLAERQIAREDSIQNASDSIVEILTDSIVQGELKVVGINDRLNRANTNNWILTKKLKEREKSLDIPDTVFLSNAERITRSVYRYYRRNDTLRQKSNDSAR